MHDSFTAYGGGLTIVNMVLGEVAPGGIGLRPLRHPHRRDRRRVHRRPHGRPHAGVPGQEDRRARDEARRRSTSCTTPALVLIGPRASRWRPRRDGASILNPGPHGLSEVFYAFASASNNNGSAFAGLSANTDFYNTAPGGRDGTRPVPADLLRARARRLARPAGQGARVGRHAAHPPTAVRRCSSSASSSSSPGSPSCPPWRSARSRRDCHDHLAPTSRPRRRRESGSGVFEPEVVADRRCPKRCASSTRG